MELHERADGLVVINDAYNANPASMAAAHRGARGDRRAARRGVRSPCSARCASSGDEPSRPATREVGAVAAALGVDVVVVVGDPRRGHRARRAPASRTGTGEAIVTAGRDEALAWVRENVAAGDVVLVKASRGAALETIAERLLEPRRRRRKGPRDESHPVRRRPGPADLAARHPGRDHLVHQVGLRPGDPRRRPDQPPHQARHAHHGRRGHHPRRPWSATSRPS